MKTETHLLVLLSKSYSSVSVDMIHIVIHDTLSELDIKLLTKGIVLTSEEYFQWAHRGARWKLNNIVKSSKRFLPVEAAMDVADEEDIAKRLETEEQIDGALRVLTDKERATLVLHTFFGYPYQRIANICGVTTDAVKGVLVNARRKIRKLENTPPHQ